MTTPLNQSQITQLLGTTTLTNSSGSTGSSSTNGGGFFEALAQAWGKALDDAGQQLSNESQNLNVDGQDTMSNITQLTADSTRMSFLANSSHTSISDAGDAMKAVAQK